MTKANIASIIIAAGYSSRMKDFKPLLKFGGFSAVEKVIHTHKSAGIKDIYVVVGHRGHEIVEQLKLSDVTIIWNENFDEGMFSSIVKGVETLEEDLRQKAQQNLLSLGGGRNAFFMHPVDIPLIKKQTLEVLVTEYKRQDKGIIYPVFDCRKGHPPLIDCKYNRAILASNGEGGLKRVLEGFSEDSLHVPVFDEAILKDMDTKKDYEQLLTLPLKAPSKSECLAILEYYQVADHIIRHCQKVAEVTKEIIDLLKNDHYVIDEEELLAAAYLHDLARHEEIHALAGSQLLSDMGYKRVGEIISTNMDIVLSTTKKVNENEILYLADKLVEEDKLVSLEERFIHRLEGINQSEEAKEKILIRYNAAKTIISKIETLTGKEFLYG